MTDETPTTPAPVPDGSAGRRARTPSAEERLPATVPPQQLTADRFTAAAADQEQRRPDARPGRPGSSASRRPPAGSAS